MVRPLSTATARDVNGGQITTSTPSGGENAEQKARVSACVLNIFQLPAISTSRSYVSGIAATPGSSLPARSSRDAPPPVDTQETSCVRPSSLSARTESPPPTTEYASESATASATAFVPSAKRGHSKTPIGPFQKIVQAPRRKEANRLRVSGPMSRPNHPSGTEW